MTQQPIVLSKQMRINWMQPLFPFYSAQPINTVKDNTIVINIGCFSCLPILVQYGISGLILGLRPAHERRRQFVTTSLIGWVQA